MVRSFHAAMEHVLAEYLQFVYRSVVNQLFFNLLDMIFWEIFNIEQGMINSDFYMIFLIFIICCSTIIF